MGRKRRIQIGLFLFLLGILIPSLGETKAATSYTNAKEFYESTGGENAYHAECYGGNMYYATCARLASSSSNLKYHTVGFDVIMNGNGQSVRFSVKRGGSLQEVPGSRVDYDGYQYILYIIPRGRLNQLTWEADSGAAVAVLGSSSIEVKMKGIITTKQNDTLNGDITENGYGGLNEWGTVYHLGRETDLAAAQKVFSGHTFESYTNIKCDLYNYELSIRYKLEGGTVGNGYSSVDDLLTLDGTQVITRSRMLSWFHLVNQSDIGLQKTGYHMVAGMEWIYEGRSFDQSQSYMPTDVYPDIISGNHGITMRANWQPNVYTIRYDANGGVGYMANTVMAYNETGNLRKLTYSRSGYTFKGWNTQADGQGISYTDQQEIYNLTSAYNVTIPLYAQWEPKVYTIVTEKQEGIGGTDTFYEKYDTGWFSDSTAKTPISAITVPVREGYELTGYFTSIFGLGDEITDQTGRIAVLPNYFLADSLIYAGWKPKNYTITFDKQGGVGGTDSAIATYGAELPLADAPVRTGYSFKGYFTGANGAGDMYYNQFMAGERRYYLDHAIILYAYWVDETPPEVVLTASSTIWTNRTITLFAEAFDYGAGLASLTLYQGEAKVAEKTGLNGGARTSLAFINPAEGVITYRAVAVDVAGNTAETYKTVYYDIKAPTGTITWESFDGKNLSITVDVTDQNVQ